MAPNDGAAPIHPTWSFVKGPPSSGVRSADMSVGNDGENQPKLQPIPNRIIFPICWENLFVKTIEKMKILYQQMWLIFEIVR